MRKLLVLLIILGLCLGCVSCSRPDSDTQKQMSANYEMPDLSPESVRGASLYFVSGDGSRFATEHRNLEFGQDEPDEYTLVSALLAGPENPELRSFAECFSLDRIEILDNVENVYLKADGTYNDHEAFVLAMAVTNTISDYSAVGYLNCYINDEALSFAGHPVGTLSKNLSPIDDEISQLQQRISVNRYPVTLYFFDESERYIIPEIREISFDNDPDYMRTIINELAKGPESDYYHIASVSSALRYISSEYIDSYGGGYTNIELNRVPFKDISTRALTNAALTYTLSGFLPGCRQVAYSVNGRKLDFGRFSKNVYREKLGSKMRIYVPYDDLSGVSGEDIVVSQSEAERPDAIVREVLKNMGMVSVPPESIVKVYIAGDIVVVNWDGSIMKKLSGMLSDSERLFTYSIVNSLIALKDINRVQFLVDGQRTEHLAGSINLMEPLYVNPGLIR